MNIEYWKIDDELRLEAERHYRTRFARQIQNLEPIDIIREITFDGIAPNITVDDIRDLLVCVVKKFLGDIGGNGLEVGAGPGTFSAVIASLPGVIKMYAVEVCLPIVELLTEKVSKFILGSCANKVIGVVGDFNHIQLPDSSLNFIFDFFSLHHSSDIHRTLRECARVLKPGGSIICFDKARPDNYSQSDINELLDRDYNDQTKKFFGVTTDQKFTRRMNGEKEYRLKDWRAAFFDAGFSDFRHFNMAKTNVGIMPIAMIKKTLSMLPINWQVFLNRFVPEREKNHRFILSKDNRVFLSALNKFPKEFSLFIARK